MVIDESVTYDANATADTYLEDFEVFDIRDVMNVVAYSIMSSGGCTGGLI